MATDEIYLPNLVDHVYKDIRMYVHTFIQSIWFIMLTNLNVMSVAKISQLNLTLNFEIS